MQNKQQQLTFNFDTRTIQCFNQFDYIGTTHFDSIQINPILQCLSSPRKTYRYSMGLFDGENIYGLKLKITFIQEEFQVFSGIYAFEDDAEMERLKLLYSNAEKEITNDDTRSYSFGYDYCVWDKKADWINTLGGQHYIEFNHVGKIYSTESDEYGGFIYNNLNNIQLTGEKKMTKNVLVSILISIIFFVIMFMVQQYFNFNKLFVGVLFIFILQHVCYITEMIIISDYYKYLFFRKKLFIKLSTCVVLNYACIYFTLIFALQKITVPILITSLILGGINMLVTIIIFQLERFINIGHKRVATQFIERKIKVHTYLRPFIFIFFPIILIFLLGFLK